MPVKENEEESDSFKTTKTMRQKAQAVGKCVLSMLKIWRLCCRKKRNKNTGLIIIYRKLTRKLTREIKKDINRRDRFERKQMSAPAVAGPEIQEEEKVCSGCATPQG